MYIESIQDVLAKYSDDECKLDSEVGIILIESDCPAYSHSNKDINIV